MLLSIYLAPYPDGNTVHKYAFLLTLSGPQSNSYRASSAASLIHGNTINSGKYAWCVQIEQGHNQQDQKLSVIQLTRTLSSTLLAPVSSSLSLSWSPVALLVLSDNHWCHFLHNMCLRNYVNIFQLGTIQENLKWACEQYNWLCML